MSELVFLLEEPSARAMLEGLLPRLLEVEIPVRYIVFEGKQDLEDRMVQRLKHYLIPDARLVILRDQDSADCHVVKQELANKCQESGRIHTLVRIACHELESWYLADLAAVEEALHLPGLAKNQTKAKYRNPDRLANAAQELEKLTKSYYQKISGSEAIGPSLNLDNHRSHSFAVFISGLRTLFADWVSNKPSNP